MVLHFYLLDGIFGLHRKTFRVRIVTGKILGQLFIASVCQSAICNAFKNVGKKKEYNFFDYVYTNSKGRNIFTQTDTL